MNVPSIICDPTKRHDFVFAVEYINSLPNGDPDAGNAPRVDPESLVGLATDVSLKRKIRDYIMIADLTEGFSADEDGNQYGIYIAQGTYLVNKHKKVYEKLGAELSKKPDLTTVQSISDEMCRLYYDVRMFGGVMNTGKEKKGNSEVYYNAGQVRGPMQISFGVSVDPVYSYELTIARVALTDAKEATEEEGGTTGTLGKKSIVPYGLYVYKGHFNPYFAKRTGVTSKDLECFWQALQYTWDLDVTSARGEVNLRSLHVFTHESPLGNEKSYKLFDKIRYKAKEGVTVPRKYHDYDADVMVENLPHGITYTGL
jgi:CRISPR-associated protein Csd2